MPIKNTFHQLGFASLVLSLSNAVMASQDCDLALDLLFRADHLHRRAVSQQKLLFKKSLQLCPNGAEVHHSLASVLKKQGQYLEAFYHYKQAVNYDPHFNKAWYELGKIYDQQKRFPLSLEAHLHACQTHKGSKARATALLKEKRYAYTNKGDIIEKESLLVLYDKQRRQMLNHKISDCGLSGVAEIEPVHTFLNLQFEAGQTTLPAGSQSQLAEIAAALQQPHSPTITIQGHIDKRPFKQVDWETNEKQNQKLSEERAARISAALAQQGISMERIKTQAYGNSQTTKHQ